MAVRDSRTRGGTLRAAALGLLTGFLAALAAAPGASGAIAGDLDRSFAGDGRAITDFGRLEELNGLALGSDGRPVAVGDSVGRGGTPFTAARAAVAVARYRPGGRLDRSFSGDGKRLLRFGWPQSYGEDAAVGEGGAIVVVATVAVVGEGTEESHIGVARLKRGGGLDESFGGAGKAVPDFGGEFESASAVAIQPDRRVVVAGTAEQPPYSPGQVALARLQANGEPDPSFGGDGTVVEDLGAGSRVMDLVITPSGELVVVGSMNSHFLVARFGSDGSLEDMQTTDFGGPDIATAVAIDADGRIVVAGTTGHDAELFALARYEPDLSLDPTFGGGGTVTSPPGGFPSGGGVAIQDDGRIVVGTGSLALAGDRIVAGGVWWGDDRGDLGALARFESDGDLDPTFFDGGVRRRTRFPAERVANKFALAAYHRDAVCAGKRATIVGTPGADSIAGTTRRDVIATGPGDDVVRGRGGSDVICADGGDDQIRANRGADLLIGGAGDDALRGHRGPDDLRGNEGNDLLIGGRGSDRCRGGPGRDRFRGCR